MDIKQHTAILHLATGATNKEAADAAKVSVSTIDKWKRTEDFQNLVSDAIQKIYLVGIAELAKGTLDAAKELRRIATDPDSSDRVKVSAITTLFGQLEKVRGWDLENRLSRIEGILEENGTDIKQAEST